MEIEAIEERALRSLRPPPRQRMSDWIEAHVQLPDGVTSQPGPVRLWPFQREIADAIGDPALERVTLVKPVRVGFTTLLTSAVASFVANDPAPILYLLPTESDCRDYTVSDLEPIFGATPAVATALSGATASGDDIDRNTLMSRRFPGGSLKIVAAKSPRNLRRHNVRVLMIDEADGMEATAEGSPIMLAEKRTMSFPDRKIIIGSTPVHEDTSQVLRSYAQSDKRIYEVPCPECAAFHEILWDAIRWDEGKPETAHWVCPSCGSVVDEEKKAGIVAAGRWRATEPQIKGHAGFAMNALISLHANASWAKLALEFLGSKNDPVTLQTFVNTILGQGWRGEGEEIDEGALARLVAPDVRLDLVPEDVLILTVGIDVQHDRLEVTICGWTEAGRCDVLAHRVVWGAWNDDETWGELSDLLGQTWAHALGGKIGIDVVAIDSGDGTTMDKVLAFTIGRRKVFPIKGMGGNRALIEKSHSTRRSLQKLWLVGVDTAKHLLFRRFTGGASIRLSPDLPPQWYEQATSDRVVTRYTRGQPLRTFERLPGKRAEALDCLVYALAARQMTNPDWMQRRSEAAGGATKQRAPRKPDPEGAWIPKKSDWIPR